MTDKASTLDPLDNERLTVEDLYRELAHCDCDAAFAGLVEMPTDVLLTEGAGALLDAAAYLRFVAEHHVPPGSARAQHIGELVEALTDQAGELFSVADCASIAIRIANRRESSS